MKICDLHSHSTFSDGTCTPTELVHTAEQLNISALALTDHNTSAGLSKFMAAGEKSSVITVAGCEFSTDYEGAELHIIGLFFPKETWSRIDEYTEQLLMRKHESNLVLIERLQRAGYDITYEEVAATTNAAEFNRSHVAVALLCKGYVESRWDAFRKLLNQGRGFYEPPKRPNSLETIAFIKSLGAVAVLAHPFLNMRLPSLRSFLPKAKERGLDAIETHYTDFNEEYTKKAERLAESFGLLQSGGSDFHGEAKPGISLGRGRGDLYVPFEFYESLRP